MSTTSVSRNVREKVHRSRSRFWRPEDFEGSPEAVAQALSRLERLGELRRVRRGLYWRGRSTPLGMAPPPADRLVKEVVHEPGSGPAAWSAALALGLSTQVPRYETIAVPGRAPRAPRGLRFVGRASSKRGSEALRPVEVALFEVLRDWDTLVEIPATDAVSRIRDAIDSDAIRLDRVVRAAATEPAHVRERFRRLLAAIGHEDRATDVRPARSDSARGDLALAS